MGALAGPIIIGLSTLAATGATLDSAAKSRKQAKRIADETKGSQEKLAAEAETRLKREEQGTERTKVRDDARRRQRQRTIGAGGRRDTILTGSLGLVDQPQAARKTLLGA